jgi:cobalt/nickel transport system permease protein
VHDLAPHSKIAAGFFFILVVVATPITNFVAYIIFLLLIIFIIVLSQLPFKIVFKRALIEIPFVIFALLMPFFGSGEKIEFAGLKLYEAGLLAGASIVAKGTLGVLVAIILSATTSARELLRGLERLRTPLQLVNIATFMLRYINVINDELSRMRVARESRGFEATGIRSWPIIAKTLGALFIRAFERGERVYLAMLARGYDGKIPTTHEQQHERKLAAFLLPALGLVGSLLSWRLI